MSKELGDVAQAVGFVAVDGFKGFVEGLGEVVHPHAAHFAEAFRHQAVKLEIGAFLRATFNDHIAKFDLYEEEKKCCQM
jgi:hypothetical protein